MSIWSWLWVAWLAAFAALEGVALVRKAPDDTLSEHLWKWFAIGQPGARPPMTGAVQLRRFALLAGLVWLAAHLLTGGIF